MTWDGRLVVEAEVARWGSSCAWPTAIVDLACWR